MESQAKTSLFQLLFEFLDARLHAPAFFPDAIALGQKIGVLFFHEFVLGKRLVPRGPYPNTIELDGVRLQFYKEWFFLA